MKPIRRVTFTVAGIAQPKGSAHAFVPKSWADKAHKIGKAPRAIVTSDNPRAKGWQQLVAEQAQTVAGDVFLGAVILTVTFALPRPASAPLKIRHHLTNPDLDKLVRCVADALTGILYLDDKQVVEMHARKIFAQSPKGPRADVTLEDAAPVFEAALAGSLFD